MNAMDDKIKAIKSRNEKRKRDYGESQQRADGEMYTVGADEDIDTLLAEIAEMTRNHEYLSLRCEGLHNKLMELGFSCGTFCQEYARAEAAQRGIELPSWGIEHSSLEDAAVTNEKRLG